LAWRWSNVGVELASGYGWTSGRTKGTLQDDPFFPSMDVFVHDDVTVAPTTVTFKLALPSALLRPYALAGAGITFVRVDRRPEPDSAWAWQGNQHLSADSFIATYHFGAGATFRIARRVVGTVEARYTGGKKAELLTDAIPMESVGVSAGVGYSF
jgi:hypothetical protein